MKRAEEVTFGGSGLDRAAHLRNDATGLASLWFAADAQILLMWRGKPLCLHPSETAQNAAARPVELALVASDSPIVAGLADRALFLGMSEEGAGYFAVDISTWDPADTEPESGQGFQDVSEIRHPDLPHSHVFVELRRVMTLLTPREAELASTAKALLSWHASHGFCAACGAPSVVEQAGWQRRCPRCATGHFPRTDPVVIMLITHGDRVLLGRSPGWPEGMYSLLAGFVEPGETLEAAVRREVLEEAGISVGQVRYLASQPWAFPMSLMFGCWGEALDTQITIDPHEIEDALWLTRQEAMDVFAGSHPKVLPARRGAIAHFIMENWLADTLV